MFFFLAKALWSILAPTNGLVLLGLGGCIASRFARTARWGVRLMAASVLGLGVCAATPLGNWLLAPLESPFSLYPEHSGPVAGIVVLGGGETQPGGVRNRVQVNEDGDRYFEAARLARAYPSARVIVSNGDGAEDTAAMLTELGVNPTRLELDRRSKDTYENAVYSRILARPRQGERWLLVTSAYHMRRALGAFRRAGFDVYPAPASWRQSPAGSHKPWSATENLGRVDLAMREYLGLVSYWLRGRSSALFPGP